MKPIDEVEVDVPGAPNMASLRFVRPLLVRALPVRTRIAQSDQPEGWLWGWLLGAGFVQERSHRS